jgi:mRNA-degrading endonuclease RelE of RelBE toxin-antitoxin system
MAGDSWTIRTSERASDEISELPRAAQKEVFALIELLIEEPIPDGAVRMRRYNNVYRLRLGTANYRLVYRVDRRRRLIEIFRIRPRGTVYRGLRGPE